MSKELSFNIGICDDETSWHRRLNLICDEYLNQKGLTHEIYSFYSGEDIIRENEKEIDLLFLDVEMYGMGGLETMKVVETMPNIKRIVFISSHPEAVWDSFGYKTKGFIPKPFEDSSIYELMDKMYREVIENTYVDFTDVNGSDSIKKSDIVYIKSDSGYITIFLKDTQKFLSCTLKECEDKLGGLPFLRIHRSYIVNLMHVKNVLSDTVEMQNGDSYTIGRSYRGQVKKKYQEYLRRELHA